jgi:hypothetical protein
LVLPKYLTIKHFGTAKISNNQALWYCQNIYQSSTLTQTKYLTIKHNVATKISNNQAKHEFPKNK